MERNQNSLCFYYKRKRFLVEGKIMSGYYYERWLNAAYLRGTAEAGGSDLRVLVQGSPSSARVSAAGPGPWPSQLAEPCRRQAGELRGHASLRVLPPQTLPTSHLFYQLLTRPAVCVGGSQASKTIPRSLISIHEHVQDWEEGEGSAPPAAGLLCKGCAVLSESSVW